MYKARQPRSTFGSWDVQKCTPLWREALFEAQMCKTLHARATFGRFSVVLCGRRKGFSTLPKVSKRWRFCSISKNDGRRVTFEEDLQRYISRGRRSAKTCSSEMLGGQAADFLRGVAFWSIRPSGLRRWFCVTGAALCMTWHHLFVAGGVEKLQNALVREGSLAEFFRFWCCQLQKLRKSPRIAVFLMLSPSKMEEVLQNCCVFDVVKLKDRGSLAE